MSCGSTTSNSTYTIDALSPSLPDVGWWKIPFVWLVGMAQAWERQCQYKELLELDDRLLADMACRGRPSKRCADPRYTWLRGATADSNLDAFPATGDASCPLRALAANGYGCNEANCGRDKTTSLRSLCP